MTETVAVIGAGTMGRDITQRFISHGVRVVLWSRTHATLSHAQRVLEHRLGVGSTFFGDLVLTTSLDTALRNATFIIETVPETARQHVWRELNARVTNKHVLTTNTSTGPIQPWANLAKFPEHVLGWHFINPANLIHITEVIGAGQTSQAAYRRVFDLAKKVQLTPVVVSDYLGFALNNIIFTGLREALRIHEEQRTPIDVIDALMCASWKMGPFEMMDLIGIDVTRDTMSELFPALLTPTLDSLVWRGHLGRKTCRGFYDYQL